MTTAPLPSTRIAYRAFSDINAYADDLYGLYRSLYADVPEIKLEETLQDAHSLDYCKRRKYFVLVVPYTSHRQLLVELAFDWKLSWLLVGGSLRSDRMETFIDAANRLASACVTKVELGEVEPVAFLENRWKFGDQVSRHLGIAFMARVRNPYPERLLRATLHSRGQFVPHDDTSVPFSLPHNDQVTGLARQYLARKNLEDAPEAEIAENIKYRWRYRLHDRLMKPAFRFFGRLNLLRHLGLFQFTLEEFDQRIRDILLAGPHERILDVVCGENKSVIELAKLPGVSLAVGNDVSWSQIKMLTGRYKDSDLRDMDSFVLFTNHDARWLPFADKVFDFVICKNVLHHMNDLAAVRAYPDNPAQR